jgi:hypothetical protein
VLTISHLFQQLHQIPFISFIEVKYTCPVWNERYGNPPTRTPPPAKAVRLNARKSEWCNSRKFPPSDSKRFNDKGLKSTAVTESKLVATEGRRGESDGDI